MNKGEGDNYHIYFRIGSFIGEVRSNDQEFISDFRQAFYEETEPVRNAHVRYRVMVDRTFRLSKLHSIRGPSDNKLMFVTAFYPSILHSLENNISQQVAQSLKDHCILQGGFVSYDGEGLLFVGGQETGRNLLIKALTERDCVYYGDGLSILDMPRFDVIHFPKSIAVERSANPLTSFQRENLTFRDPNRTSIRYILPRKYASSWKETHPIHFIFFPVKKISEKQELAPLGKADALVRLMENTFQLEEDNEKRFEYLADLVRSAHCFSINIKGLKKTTDLIFEQVRNYK